MIRCVILCGALIASVLLAAACAETQPTPTPVATVTPLAIEGTEASFLALGDSYTIGEGVKASERWPVQLAESLRQDGVAISDPLIIARTGWSTSHLFAATERAEPVGPYDLVTLMIGVNDQFRGRPVETYRDRLVELLLLALALAGGEESRVIVLSIPDWGATPFAREEDRPRIATEIDLFNMVTQEEAQAVGTRYVDVTPISRQAGATSDMLAGDGLHPSGKMYRAWMKLVLPQAHAALGTR